MADPAWWPALEVSIAFSTNPGSAPGAWTDITDYVVDFQTNRGRSNELQRFQAGTATITLDNKDGRFDPTYTSGAYYPNVLPMRHIRIRATWNAVTYGVFRGFVEAWPPTWPNAWEDIVTVQCTDAFKALQLAPYIAARGAESTGDRVFSILTASVPGITTSVEVGISTLVAITYDRESSLAAIQAIEETENGEFWISKDGAATFRSRQWRALNKGTSTATFGDVSFSDIDYEDPKLTFDDSFLYNSVKTTDSAASPNIGTASDAASQTKYLVRGLERTLLIDSATEVQDAADYLVGLYKDPRLRVDQLHLNSAPQATTQWPVLLGFELGDRVSFKRTTPAGNPIIMDFHVDQIQHTAKRSTSDDPWWRATVSLTPATNTALWILDSTTNSVLDSTTRLSY